MTGRSTTKCEIALKAIEAAARGQKGATVAEAAIVFGVVAAIVAMVILVVMPKINSYSQQQQIAEAVGLATGYTVSLGNLSQTAVPDPAVTAASLASLASLVASNSVPTCAWLVETNGTKSGNDCVAMTATVYIDPNTSSPFPAQGNTGTDCSTEVLAPGSPGLDKAARFARTECASRGFFGVTRPKDPVLATSASQYGVQPGASVELLEYRTGGS